MIRLARPKVISEEDLNNGTPVSFNSIEVEPEVAKQIRAVDPLYSEMGTPMPYLQQAGYLPKEEPAPIIPFAPAPIAQEPIAPAPVVETPVAQTPNRIDPRTLPNFKPDVLGNRVPERSDIGKIAKKAFEPSYFSSATLPLMGIIESIFTKGKGHAFNDALKSYQVGANIGSRFNKATTGSKSAVAARPLTQEQVDFINQLPFSEEYKASLISDPVQGHKLLDTYGTNLFSKDRNSKTALPTSAQEAYITKAVEDNIITQEAGQAALSSYKSAEAAMNDLRDQELKDNSKIKEEDVDRLVNDLPPELRTAWADGMASELKAAIRLKQYNRATELANKLTSSIAASGIVDEKKAVDILMLLPALNNSQRIAYYNDWMRAVDPATKAEVLNTASSDARKLTTGGTQEKLRAIRKSMRIGLDKAQIALDGMSDDTLGKDSKAYVDGMTEATAKALGVEIDPNSTSKSKWDGYMQQLAGLAKGANIPVLSYLTESSAYAGMSTEGKEFFNGMKDFITNYAHTIAGARITDSQLAQLMMRFLPTFGESSNTIRSNYTDALLILESFDDYNKNNITYAPGKGLVEIKLLPYNISNSLNKITAANDPNQVLNNLINSASKKDKSVEDIKNAKLLLGYMNSLRSYFALQAEYPNKVLRQRRPATSYNADTTYDSPYIDYKPFVNDRLKRLLNNPKFR